MPNPFTHPEIKNQFQNYGLGAYSTNSDLRKFGTTVGNLVTGQPISFSDEEGTVILDPVNQGFSVQPYEGFGLSVKGRDFSRGGTPSIEATFQFGNKKNPINMRPVFEDNQETESAGRKFLNDFLNRENESNNSSLIASY